MDTNDKQPIDQPRLGRQPSAEGDAPAAEKIDATLNEWLQRMCSNMERMARDEEYRRSIAKRLF